MMSNRKKIQYREELRKSKGNIEYIWDVISKIIPVNKNSGLAQLGKIR